MAAKKVEPAKKPAAKPAPAPAPKAQVPAKVLPQQLVPAHDYGDMNGAGFEGTTHEDFTMPFLNLLQALSPEVGAEGPDKAIEGATPGMLINSVTKELMESAIFVPVTTQHNWVEWKPREQGGGLVGRHELGSEIVTAAKSSGEFGSYKTDEGNDLIETFYMIGYLLENADATEAKDVVVIPFTSTKIKVYKRVMQMLRTFQINTPQGRRNPPLFANRLLIGSVAEKNNKGNFFNFTFAPVNGTVGASLIPPTLDDGPHPLLMFGQQLGEQVRSGARRMADEGGSAASPEGGEEAGAEAGAGKSKPPF